MDIQETLKRLVDAVVHPTAETKSAFKKHLLTAVITSIVVLVLAWLFLPRPAVPSRPIVNTVRDEAAIAAVRSEMQDIIDEKQSFIDRLLNLKQPAKPSGGEVAQPNISPIQVKLIIESGEEGEPTMNYASNPYDLPISLMATRSEITILTYNSFLHFTNAPYLKTYRFDRLTSDFELAVVPTTDPTTLEGIKLNWNERFFSFDGLYIGARTELPLRYALELSAEFSMYERLKIEATALSYPGLEARVRYRVW